VAEVVFLLCGLASVACAVLLLRGFFRTRARLLLWSSLCFIGLAVNNVLLFVDKVILPGTNLSEVRLWAATAAIALMLYGLVWDSK